MENVKIQDYLENYVGAKKTGTCRTCSKDVVWAKDRVAAHKRRTCLKVSEKERKLFAKKARPTTTNESLNVEDDEPPGASNDEIDDAMIQVFITLGISFRAVHSEVWKRFISKLNPQYAQSMPTSKAIKRKLSRSITYEED